VPGTVLDQFFQLVDESEDVYGRSLPSLG
jgi:hypothetical protein